MDRIPQSSGVACRAGDIESNRTPRGYPDSFSEDGVAMGRGRAKASHIAAAEWLGGVDDHVP